MLTFSGEIKESSSSRQRLWNNRKEKSIKKSFFEFYRLLYHSSSLEDNYSFRQKVKEATEGIIWILQIISLLWVPNLSIKHWNEHITLWEIMGYLRFDNIFSEFGMIKESLYLCIISIFIIFSSIFVLVLLIYYSFRLPKSIFGIFRQIFNFWVNVIFIPSMVLFSIFLKYNIISEKSITEYKNNNGFSEFEINVPLQLVLIFAMIVAFPMILFHTEFSGEIRHSVSCQILKAKAHSKIDLHLAIFTYFSPVIYVCLDHNYMIYFQFFMMIISAAIVVEVMQFLPYFSIYFNLAQILRLCGVSLVSFGFILGYIMDNSLFIILFAIILGPLIVLLNIHFVLKLEKNLNSNIPVNLAEINSAYQLEKSLRYSLCSNSIESKDQIIYLFEIFYIEKPFCRNKLESIWIANYCLFTLKDESLAKVKLTKTMDISELNLEANFQEYLSNKNIQNSSSDESVQFIDYFQQLNLIKKKDHKLCFNLLKFWEEITASKPDLKWLVKKLNWIDEKILAINNQYSQLTAKFFYSKDFLELYASYAKDILFDWEKSNLLENKLKSYEKSAISSYSRNPSCFNDANGIFVISGEEENFGEILFSNTKANEIIKFADGSSIMDFIPSFYSGKLKDEINWLIHYGSSSEIDLKEGFFLKLPTNFLIEITGKMIITSIDNYLVLIFIFQKKQTNRQIALISEDGEIFDYSEDFPLAAEKFKDDLKGHSLKNVFPELENFNLQLSIPYHLKNCECQTILILSYFQINRLKILHALLINDHEEIKDWINKNKALKKCKKEKANLISCPLSLNSIRSLNSEGNKNWLYHISEEDCVNPEIISNQTSINESSETAKSNRSETKEKYKPFKNLPRNKFLRLLKKSSQSINILHIAFILSVIFMQIFAVLSTNIAVLCYAYSNIDFIKNMDLPITIGKVAKKLQNISLASSILWRLGDYKNFGTELAISTSWIRLESFISELKAIYLNVTSQLENWNYCSGQEIFINEKIKLYNWEHNKKVNLLGMISQVIQTGNEMIRKANNSEDYSYEASFLYVNGIGDTFQYCNHSLYEVMDCQKSIMLDFKRDMFILLVLGIGVLILCICCMIPFWCSNAKIESNLWNNLRKKVYYHPEIKLALLKRLKSVHYQRDMLINDRNFTSSQFNFKNNWRLIWRLCIYFSAVTMFSLINITYLYEKCTDYLAYRPEIIKEIIHEQMLENSIGLSATESQFRNWGLLSVNKTPSEYPLMNSEAAFQKDILRFSRSKIMVRDPKYLPILSQNIRSKLYESHYDFWSKYFIFGVYAAEGLVRFDSYVIIHSNKLILLWLNWLRNIDTLIVNYSELTDEIDQYSQSVVEDQIKTIVAAFSFFIASSIIIYFTQYFVFFRREKQYLQKINLMMEIIPS
ncbi:unnamed protein product [Blepharisma stoltei]|uniref:TmcB/TmcC TPR repeats domain-containing protein n=1 Tax=Blepharisma stoltei TaxID=1481888 RepID=A0AAU9I9M7_9CILI|nr:unnamed protein product [Blepharisma stoltei]